MVVLGQDEENRRHALAAKMYLVRPTYLHAMHGSHQRQDVAGPRVRSAAHPVVVYPRRQVQAHVEGVRGRDELGSARGRHWHQAPSPGGEQGVYAPRCKSLRRGTPSRWEWRSCETAFGMSSLRPAGSCPSGPSDAGLSTAGSGARRLGGAGRGRVRVVGQGHAGVDGVPRVWVGLEGGCGMVVMAAGVCTGVHLLIAVGTATPRRWATTAMSSAAAAGQGPVLAAWAVPSRVLGLRLSF